MFTLADHLVGIGSGLILIPGVRMAVWGLSSVSLLSASFFYISGLALIVAGLVKGDVRYDRLLKVSFLVTAAGAILFAVVLQRDGAYPLTFSILLALPVAMLLGGLDGPEDRSSF